jgi:hypothetical protein
VLKVFEARANGRGGEAAADRHVWRPFFCGSGGGGGGSEQKKITLAGVFTFTRNRCIILSDDNHAYYR